MIECVAVLRALVEIVAWSWPLTTLSVPVPIEAAAVVEGHRTGGAGHGRAAGADDANRRGERHRLTVHRGADERSQPSRSCSPC